MNEQAIKDSYELFKTGGYSKSYEEFVELINSNPQALEDSYTIFKTGGYSKSMEEYEELMGVKKKDGTSESIVVEEGMESVSPPQPESGSSDVSAPQEAESDLEAYQNTPVTAPQEGVAVADPNLVALQEGESVYDANERVSVALAAQDDAKDQRSAFDRSLDIIDNRQHEQENKLGLNFRDKDYVVGGNIADLEEEEVVGEMDYHFKDYGFKFEETGATGDFMKVTAPNGVDTIEISLDNWTDAKDASESKKLKKFMQQNKPIEKTGLDRIESEALGNEKKILGKRDYEERMTSMQTGTIDLKDRVKDFTQRKIASDRQGKEFSRMGQAELARNQAAYDAWLVESANIKAEGGEIEGEIEGMKSRGKKLDRLVGSYIEMRSKEGSFGGGLVNSVSEGFGTLFSGVYGTGVDLITASLTQAVGAEEADKWSKSAKGLDRGGGEVNEFSQAASGFMSQERKGIQRLIRERGTAVGQGLGSGTSKEYTDSAGFVESSIYGVASSVPAMASGIVGLIAQGIDMVSAETENNPLFEDVSELEKLAIAAPIGIVAGILEKVGLTKAIAGTSAISSVTHNLLKKFGVSATTRTFSEFVENEVERGGSRFLLKMASSGLSEAETGGLQEINDILMKKIYNEVKGQDLFQTPETFGDAVLQVIEASAAEAIGGFAMGTPGAVVSGALGGNLNSVSDETFAVFESVMNDGPMKEAYIESIKQKIVAGEMTKAEGKKAIQEAEDVAGVASQIPSDYTGDQKKKALGLLLRRAKLQTQVDKGDKQLVTKQQAEIDSINESLKQISEETTTPTITEATTEEAIEALEAEDAIREKMTGKPSATARTRAVIEKKRQELNKQRQDAIQESSTTEVDVQEQATDGEAVGSGDPDGGTAEDGTQETTDVTSEDTSEPEEVAILESLFGSETGKTKEEGETQGTETKGEEAIEVGEKTKIETPDGTELEVEKMEVNVGIVSDPKVKKKRSILERAVVKIANTSAKALAKILPDTNIVLHSSPESYKKLGGRGKGMYKGNTIHINLSTATLGTISHEIFHAVLSEKLGTDSRIQLATKDMLETVMNSITDKDILNRLEKFRLLYEAASQQAGERAASLQSEYNQLAEAQDINSTPEGQAKLDSLLEQIEEATNEADGFIEVLNEEQLAEVTAILAEHYSEANSETKSAIVTWLKKISKTLGLSPTVLDRVFSNKGDAASKNQAVIDLLNTIARKTISGEEITDSDIEILEQYAKPVDKKVAPKARAEEVAPKKKVAPKPKETSAKEEFDIQDTTKRQELNEDGTKKTKAEAPAAPKSKVIGSTNLGDGYKYQGDKPAGKSLYRSGLENRHDKGGQYSPGKSLVVTETKGKEAVTKKQGLLRKTVEVSPAVEGEIIVQARATTDSAGNVLPGSRGTSSIYSTVIVDPSTMDGMSEGQKDAYLVEVQQEVKADLKAKVDALGDTSGMKENDVTNKLNALEKGRTKNQLGGGEVVPGEAVEDAEGPIPTNIPDSDGPSIDLKTKTKFNLDRGGIDMDNIKRGSVNKLEGINAFVFAADQATYGMSQSPSGLKYMFNGGFLYPYGAQSQGSNAAWVFSTEDSANKIINKANNSDGVGLVMSQAPDGITGNMQFYDYLNAEVAYAIENGASPKEMINYINRKLKLTTVAKGLKKKGLPSQISSIEELQTLLSPLNFEQRGSFAKTFLSKESYEKFNISPFTPLKSVPTNISEVVNDSSLKGVGYGDVVSAIEFEKGAKPFKLKEGDPGYHPAYPWAIPGKPLMVFDKAVDVRKIYPNAKPASLEANQTPLGERTKPLAARSAMGGQYAAKVPKDIQVKGAKVKFQLDDQGNDLSKLEEDTKYKKGDILPDAYISNNNITDPLNPAKLPKKEFTVTWEEESTWGDRVTRERKFNNGQHFVNFWRKATNDGEWDYLSNFTIHTESETITRKTQRQDDSWKKIDEIRSTTQPIDIEKLKGWNFKSKVSNPQRLKKSRSHSAYGGAYKTPRVGPSGRSKYQLAWKETPEMSMKESKIAKRTTKVEEAVNRLLRGEITNADYRKIVAKNSPIGPIEEYFAPVSRDRMESALTPNQSKKILAPLVDPDTGKELKRVGARLDIPAYLRSNAWIVTIHEPSSKGKPISYGPAVRLKNVTFETDARIAANIASGAQGKTTFAKMFGEPVAIEGNTVEEIGTNAQSMIEDVANNSDWVQVGMNPFRHSSFWDRNTGQPLGSAQEIIQIGGLVYAKNPEYLSMDDSSFTVKGKVVTDKKGKAKVVAADRSTGETFTDPVLDKEGSPVKFQLEEEVEMIKKVDKNSDDGATLNIDGSRYTGGGLVVPAATKNTTQSEITTQMIEEFIEDNDGKIGTDGVVKIGLYKFKNSDQVSIDLNIVVPAKNREAALEFGKLAGQESLFDLDTFENVKTGADGSNPIEFTDAQFRKIAKDLKNNKVPKVFDGDGSTKFQLDVDGADASIQEIITEGRGAGLKDSAIGSYLNRIKNVPKNVVKKLLEFDVDLFYKLPKSFAEVEGGLLEGMRLFKNIQDFIAKEINSNATRNKESAAQLKTKVREKRKELTKAKVKTADQMREIKRKIREGVEKTNKMRVKPRPKKEVDARVKELYEIKRLENIAAKVAVDKAMGAFETKLEKSNAKKRAKLSDQEIMDLAIERLMEHPAYKKLADTRRVKGKDVAMKDAATLQAEMVNALQKTLGVRPTKNMRQALTKLRQMVRFRNQGARQLQEAKRELLRFMRQTLPKTAYSKQEALSLARRIAQATSKDMNGLMHEVIRLSTKKNVGILSRAISKILKPYESKQSGRLKGTSIDNTTRRVVKNLMSNIKFPKTVLAKEIDDRNVQLLEEFNELANKMETTPEERQQMEGLIAAINLNNAMLMEDNDPNKAIALDRAYAAIKGLIDGGRSNLKETLAREKAEFDKSYKEIHKDITGEDIPLYEEDVLDDDGKVIHEKGDINFDAIDLKVLAKKNRARAKETQNRLVKALRSFTDMVKNYFLKQNDLGGMINKISKLPGELFGGITDQQVVDRIDEGTRVEKANNLMMKRSVENKMKELWGKMWKFKVGALASVNKTGIYIDQTVVDKAQKAYDDNPTSENKVNLREAKRDQEISMSQGEAYYLYNQFKDPSNHPSFESRFGKDYERIMGELTSTLDAETKAFADWQVDEFFPMVYPIFNEAYLKVYKTDMPWNEFYAGPLMHDGQAIQDLDLLANKGSNTVVTAGSSKYRVQTKDPIKEGVDGTANLMFYIEEMNHLAGMAEPINYINKLLLNPKMASTIKAIYGSDVLQGIRLSIERVANKGRINKGARFVNFMNSAFITSRLGINPVVMVKQLTSFFTYASDIGYANWVRYAAVNTVQMRKIFKEIKANSVYMDDRNYQSIMKAIETYAPERVQKFMPQPIQNALINIAMWTTKFGDKAAIYIGGMPNYSYHKAQFKKNNPGATEQQAIDYAIRRFEKDTKNTQQSSDIQNKDLYQTGDGYMRVLNMFMTTPKQYNRKVIRSLRNLSRIIKSGGTEGKGTLISNARTILTYHFVMPMFFQWVSLGFPLGSDWDEEDTDDMMRAAIIGNFNSLFIAGDVIGMIADWAQGKPYAFNMPAIPALDMPKNVALYMDKAAKAKTPETKEKWTRKAINEGLAMFGIPASNIQKIFNNFTKLTTEGMEPKEALLRVLQYSDYVIDGPEEKKKKKKKLTDKEMKEYFPEQYKREQELEEMIKEMTYNPEVEALEAEIKAMEDEVRREMLEAMRE